MKTLRQRGATLVEFAFVAPILLTLVIGTIWIARAFNVYQTATRAAREGARYAVLPNCASCGNVYVDTYSAIDTCLGTSSNVFTGYVAPALQASSLDPASISSTGSGTNGACTAGDSKGCYCQSAIWLEGTTNPRQCGVQITFRYPVTLTIPFTSVNAATLNIPASVQMRFENQAVDNAGNPTCP
jgi:Flp pilus assembly protein TadG